MLLDELAIDARADAVWAGPVINEFANVNADVLAGVIISLMSRFGGNVLTGVLTAVLTFLEFAKLEESLIFD